MKQYSLVDLAEVTVQGGSGGEGAFSFYHYRNGHTQGDGGNGGRGGDAYFSVHTGLYDLTKLRQKNSYKALPGGRGSSNNKSGKDGEPVFVEVPLGTLIRDSRGALLADLDSKDGRFLAAHGGAAGQGNYKKAKNFTSHPRPGEEVRYQLDFRIPHDIALVGPPNTGKTTIVNRVAGQDFKVSPFPFTTALPVWAPAEHDFRTFTIMELPAIIKVSKLELVNEQYLKHLYRSKVVVLVSAADRKYQDDFTAIQSFLKEHLQEDYSRKKIVLLVNKAQNKTSSAVKKDGKYTWCNAEHVQAGKALGRFLQGLL